MMPRIGGPSRGCQVCRARKIKCDETLPKCRKCVESGRSCPGPITDPFFQDMTEEISSGTSIRRRIQKTVKTKKTSKLRFVESGCKTTIIRKRNTTRMTEKTCAVVKESVCGRASHYEHTRSGAAIASKNPNNKPQDLVAPSTVQKPSKAVPYEKLARFSDSASHYCTHLSKSQPSTTVSSNRRSLPAPIFNNSQDTVAATDPFGTLAIQLNQKNELLVYHYIHVLGPSAGYKSVPLLGPTKKNFDPQKRFWLPLIFSDKVFFHAMLAAAASHRSRLLLPQDNSATLQPLHEQTEILALFHKAEACRLLNKKFVSGVEALSNAALSAVLYLIATELIVGEIEHIYVHLAGLFQMVALRGGMQTLPRILAFSVNFTDTMLALQTLGKPLFPLHDIDWQIRSPQSLRLKEAENQIGNASSGSRLLHSELSDILPKDMLEVFKEVHDLANHFELIDQVVTTPEQLDDLEYRCVSVQYRLLSYDYNCPALNDQSLDLNKTIQKLCLISTLIFFASGVWRFPDVLPETVQLSEAVSLTHNLLQQKSLDICMEFFGDIILWTSFFAGFTARGTQRQFFLSQIKEVAEAKGIRSFHEAQSLLGSFLYRWKVFGSIFQSLWEESMACEI